MMIPPIVFSSAAAGSMRTLSAKGLIAIINIFLFFVPFLRRFGLRLCDISFLAHPVPIRQR
jgi:hypothetical protein